MSSILFLFLYVVFEDANCIFRRSVVVEPSSGPGDVGFGLPVIDKVYKLNRSNGFDIQ